MGPVDYTLQVQQPFESALQGYQAGAAIRNDQQQQQAIAAQQAQAQKLQALYSETASNPTADNYSRLMLADPKASEGIKRAWEVKNAQQQQAQTADLLQWGAAIKSGKPQIAAQALRQRADLIEQQAGAPTQEAQVLRTQAQLAEEHPEFALGQIQALLAANPNGKDAAETLAKFGTEARADAQAPGALRKVNADATAAEADAVTKGVQAKFAEPQALKDLELKGWNIENIKSEIGYRKESNRIAAMNAAANREGNDLKRQELKLKIQETQNALAEKARAKVADVESATSSIDNLINTVDRLKKNPGLKDVLGSVEGSDWYPNQLAAASTVVSPYGFFASSGDDRADAIALIQTLGSQAFISQIPAMKGTGSLTEKEGDKLQSSLQNLTRKQSEKQFNANLDEVQRLMLNARKNVETRYGIKAGVPDTPAVQTSAPDIDALVKKYGGG